MNLVAAVAGVTASTLCARENRRQLASARHAAILALASEAGLSGADIAQLFGRTRQWASLYGRMVANDAIKAKRTRDVADRIRALLRSGVSPSPSKIRPRSATETTRKFLPGLARYRKVSGLTITQLARRAGLPRETVSRIEQLHRGARSGLMNAPATALGVRIQDLVTRMSSAVSTTAAGKTATIPKVHPIVARRVMRLETGFQIGTDCGEAKPLTAFTPIRQCRDGFYPPL